ncbi:hypothetical protein ABW19_dt0204104 [Dactylella cylindrospora]|nr:hypothetical protein ABW19_dt0204104 [Dactylella cylindrospora]
MHFANISVLVLSSIFTLACAAPGVFEPDWLYFNATEEERKNPPQDPSDPSVRRNSPSSGFAIPEFSSFYKAYEIMHIMNEWNEIHRGNSWMVELYGAEGPKEIPPILCLIDGSLPNAIGEPLGVGWCSWDDLLNPQSHQRWHLRYGASTTFTPDFETNPGWAWEIAGMMWNNKTERCVETEYNFAGDFPVNKTRAGRMVSAPCDINKPEQRLLLRRIRPRVRKFKSEGGFSEYDLCTGCYQAVK